jgi:hypothetical protein
MKSSLYVCVPPCVPVSKLPTTRSYYSIQYRVYSVLCVCVAKEPAVIQYSIRGASSIWWLRWMDIYNISTSQDPTLKRKEKNWFGWESAVYVEDPRRGIAPLRPITPHLFYFWRFWLYKTMDTRSGVFFFFLRLSRFVNQSSNKEEIISPKDNAPPILGMMLITAGNWFFGLLTIETN